MLFYIINIFFIYSFLGFIFESVLCAFISPGFESGVLMGPWTFIYGIAIFVIMILNRFLKQFKIKKVFEVLIFYLASVILMTLIEFSGGMLIEKILHVVYWDYSNMKFHYGHYICLEVSLLWGLFATFINYVVAPHLKKFAKVVPKIISVIVLILFIIDVLISFQK